MDHPTTPTPSFAACLLELLSTLAATRFPECTLLSVSVTVVTPEGIQQTIRLDGLAERLARDPPPAAS